MQICESCRGKYATDLAFCPYCHHKSSLKQHVEGAKFTLEQERTIIGYVGGALVFGACLLALWVFKYQGAEIEYRVLGLQDFQFTVDTSVRRRDGNGLRLAGTTTYWYKPGRLRLDLVSGDDPVRRPLTRLARLGEGEMYTVDTAAGVCFAQSYSPGALQAPVVGGSTPTAWTPSSSPQTMFSLLGNFQSGGYAPPVQLIQAPARTAEAPTGPFRSYKLENLGRAQVNSFPTIHYRLTTFVSARGCAGLGDGQEVTDYWIAPNLNGRFFEEEPSEAQSTRSSGNSLDDETAVPSPTPDSKAEPTATPLPTAETPAARSGSTPLPIPTPYSPATTISTLRPALSLVPNPPDACTVGNLRNGEEADFQNLFKGFIMKLRQYQGSTLVMEQKVRKFKRLQLSDDDFKASRYTLLDANEFWARRAAPLPKGTTPKR